MLIRLFKNYNPVGVFIALPLVAMLLWMTGLKNVSFLNPGINHMPLYEPVVIFFKTFPFSSYVAGCLLIFIEGALLNYIINKQDASLKKSNLTAVCYVVLMSAFGGMLQLHPVIFANFFLILMLNRLLSVYRQPQIFSIAFDSGAFIALASLFYFPAVFIFPLIWIAFLIIRPINWREYVISLIGLIFPYLFVVTYYFYNDGLSNLWQLKITNVFVNSGILTAGNVAVKSMLIVLSVLILLSALQVFNIVNVAVKVQYHLRVLLAFLILSLVVVFFTGNHEVYIYGLVMLPFSVLLGNYLLTFKKWWMPELLFLSVISMILFQFFYR